MKRIICKIRGHILESESITKTRNPNNWCKKCIRCGRYILHGDIGSVVITEKEAFRFVKEFEEEMALIDKYVKGGVKNDH